MRVHLFSHSSYLILAHKVTDFQLDLELHLPGVTVERYFTYSQGSRLKAYEAMKLITEAFLAILTV